MDDYEFINLRKDEAARTLEILKDKRKINEFSLNVILSKSEISLAKFDIIEEKEKMMFQKVMEKAEKETQGKYQNRHFILLSKIREELKSGILLKVIAEIYFME